MTPPWVMPPAGDTLAEQAKERGVDLPLWRLASELRAESWRLAPNIQDDWYPAPAEDSPTGLCWWSRRQAESKVISDGARLCLEKLDDEVLSMLDFRVRKEDVQ